MYPPKRSFFGAWCDFPSVKPCVRISRIRLSIECFSLCHDFRPFFSVNGNLHISVHTANSAHSFSSLRKETLRTITHHIFFCQGILLIICNRSVECRGTVVAESDVLFWVPSLHGGIRRCASTAPIRSARALRMPRPWRLMRTESHATIPGLP